MMAFATIAADLDFIPGILVGNPDWLHHRGSHSLLAAALFAIVAGVVAHVRGGRHARMFGVMLAAAYASHLLLDMMATEGRPRYGVPLFWPLPLYVNAPINLFLPIEREAGGATNFIASLLSWHNWHALVREVLVMGSAFVATYLAGLAVSFSRQRKAGSR